MLADSLPIKSVCPDLGEAHVGNSSQHLHRDIHESPGMSIESTSFITFAGLKNNQLVRPGGFLWALWFVIAGIGNSSGPPHSEPLWRGLNCTGFLTRVSEKLDHGKCSVSHFRLSEILPVSFGLFVFSAVHKNTLGECAPGV